MALGQETIVGAQAQDTSPGRGMSRKGCDGGLGKRVEVQTKEVVCSEENRKLLKRQVVEFGKIEPDGEELVIGAAEH